MKFFTRAMISFLEKLCIVSWISSSSSINAVGQEEVRFSFIPPQRLGTNKCQEAIEHKNRPSVMLASKSFINFLDIHSLNNMGTNS